MLCSPIRIAYRATMYYFQSSLPRALCSIAILIESDALKSVWIKLCPAKICKEPSISCACRLDAAVLQRLVKRRVQPQDPSNIFTSQPHRTVQHNRPEPTSRHQWTKLSWTSQLVRERVQLSLASVQSYCTSRPWTISRSTAAAESMWQAMPTWLVDRLQPLVTTGRSVKFGLFSDYLALN